jgi:hypothetical protein
MEGILKHWVVITACGLFICSAVLIAPSSMAEALDVEPLAAGDDQVLKGELRCSFTDSDDRVLLLGAGFVADKGAPTGVIRISGEAVPMNGEKGGGFEALTAGPQFTSGEGATAQIDRAAKNLDDGEGSKWEASLTVAAQGGESKTFEDGFWSCGP